MKLRVLIVAVLVAAGLAVASRVDAAPPCTVNWDGPASGRWTTGTNWDTNTPPGKDAVVCIPAGVTVTYDANDPAIARLLAEGTLELSSGTLTLTDAANPSHANGFAQTGGTLDGAGELDLPNGGRWGGGSMAGAGRTVVPAGETLTLDTFSVSLAGGRVLENAGTMVLATTDRGISGFETARVVNSGVIRKTVGSSTSSVVSNFISAPVENDGKVESVAANGNVNLTGGSGGTSTGTYGVAGAAGTVTLAGSVAHTLGDGAKLLGGAVVDGPVTVSGAASAAGASMTGGTLSGDGVLSITGAFRWAGGTMAGDGRTVVQAGQTLTLDTFSVSLAGGRVLENAGTMVLATTDRGISGFETARVVNSGVIRKTVGSSTSSVVSNFISAPVENDGKIESTAANGNLNVTNGSGGTSTGAYGRAGEAGTVTLAGSVAHTLGDGAQLLAGAVLAASNVTIPAGATATAVGASMTSGSIEGDGTLAVPSGTFTWAGGTMGGAGLLRVDSGGTASLTGSVSLDDTRRIDVAGTAALVGDHFIGFSQTALIHVLDGGRLRKTTGTATGGTDVFVPVQNDGTVETISGELDLENGAGVVSGGTFKGHSATQRLVLSGQGHVLTAAATLGDFTELAGDVAIQDGDTLPVASEIYQTSGSSLSGNVDITGTLHWDAGEQTGPGTTTVEPAGRIELADSCFDASLAEGHRLVNQGTVLLTGHSVLSGFGDTDPAIDNAGTITIDDSAAGGCDDLSGISGSLLLHNAGTIEKVGGTDEGQLSGRIDNDGTIRVTKGTLRLDSDDDGALEQTGTFTSSPGASYAFDGGTFALGQGAVVGGSPSVTGGELRLLEGVDADVPADGTLTLADGTITGDGTLEVLGTLVWHGGTQSGSGTTHIGAGGKLEITPAAGDDQAFAELEGSRAVVNDGDATITDGTIDAFDGAALLNRGTITISGESAIEGPGFGDFSGGGLLHNVGTIRKTGTSTVQVTLALDNDGTIEVAAGTFSPSGLLNLSDDFGFGGIERSLVDGTYIVRAGATLGLRDTLGTVAAQLVLDGAGSKVAVTDFDGTATDDAIADLRRVAGNGTLELSGGRSLSNQTADGTFTNDGVLALGSGSTFTAAAGYAQSGGGVLRSAVGPSGAAGRLSTTSAALDGRLDVVSPQHPPAGTDVTVVGYGSHSGQFARVTGANGLAVRYDPDGVKLNVTSSLGAAPRVPDVGAAPKAGEPAPQRLAAASLSVRGPWAKRGGYLVAKRRGAKLVRRAVRGRGIDLVAATCPRCGSVRVTWAGRSHKISLRSRRAHRRTLRVARLARPRTSRLVLRTTSARKVAVAALLVRR